MIYDGFQTAVWQTERWTPHRTKEYDFWDPATEIRPLPGSLTIHLPSFTRSHPNHVKALMLSSESFEVSRTQSFRVRSEMAVRTFGTANNPFGLDPGDIRLAAGAMVTIDKETGMVFDFFVSNNCIRALYERLPVARNQLGAYPAFTTFIGEPRTTKAGAWHRYEIRYDGRADRVEWWVDGSQIAAQDRIGAPVDSPAPAVSLRRLNFGGGLFTLLDGLADDRESADDHPRSTGLIPSNWEDRFGQGGEVVFKYFEVDL
jgi:hypothetical protein